MGYTPEENDSLLINHYLCINSQWVAGLHKALTSCSRTSNSPVLYRPCAWDHRCCEFESAAAMSWKSADMNRHTVCECMGEPGQTYRVTTHTFLFSECIASTISPQEGFHFFVDAKCSLRLTKHFCLFFSPNSVK